MDRLWDLALRDELTGAWNRRYFLRFLRAILDRASRERFRVTLMVFDIDGFKTYNDRFGHAAGDEILRETARLMRSVVREQDVVARIGGDEFAVIFWDAQGPRKPNSQHPVDVRKAAERFQKAIRDQKFPKLLCAVPVSLTISGGLAGFPWDGRTPEELLARADAMAMHCKQQGKNALVFGHGAALIEGTPPAGGA
jgi:diguanylate cyclase (GGDEF)-like protein